MKKRKKRGKKERRRDKKRQAAIAVAILIAKRYEGNDTGVRTSEMVPQRDGDTRVKGIFNK